MANIPLESITFPGLSDKYTIPQIDTTLAVAGKAADAKATGDAIADVVEDVTAIEQTLPSIESASLSAYATDTAEGAIVSFADGADLVPVKGLTVEIEPVQDLHGQTSPYPAGGGKNKLEPLSLQSLKTLNSGWTWNNNVASVNGVSIECIVENDVCTGEYKVTGTSTAVASFYINRMEAGNFAGMVLNGIPSYSSSRWEMYYALQAAPYTAWGYDIGNGVTLSESASGMSVLVLCIKSNKTFSDVFKPMIRLASESDATYAPYSNICPITGWTQAKVTRAGVNVWDEEWVNGYYNLNGVFVAGDDNIACKNKIHVSPSTNYTFNSINKNGGRICFYDADEAFISTISGFSNRDSYLFTTPSNAYYITFDMTSTYGTTYNHDVSINYPSADHNYHAGHVQTCTIDLSGTRYGGTLDVGSGVLTVTHGIVDLGTLTWGRNQYNTDYYFFKTGVLSDKALNYNFITSHYRNIENGRNALTDKTVGTYNNANDRNIICIRDDDYTSETDFKTAMNGVQLVYELKEPVTVQLTAEEVTTLLGQNNIFADCGDVEVEYRADTKKYIEKMLNA